MNEEFIIDLAQRSIKVTAVIGAPMLLGALVIGILVSLFQAVTQINEQTLTFIPKIVVIGICIIIFGPWMIDQLVSFTREIIINIPSWVGGE